MTLHTVKPILLSPEQIEKIKALQEVERKKSPLGLAPTLHAIARQLMDRALTEVMGA